MVVVLFRDVIFFLQVFFHFLLYSHYHLGPLIGRCFIQLLHLEIYILPMLVSFAIVLPILSVYLACPGLRVLIAELFVRFPYACCPLSYLGDAS